MSDINHTDIERGALETDNLVLFPSAQSFPEQDRRDPMYGLIEEFEALEGAIPEETLDELERASAEIQDMDFGRLNLSEIMGLTQTQLSILKETGERIDYLLREIESVIPRRK